MRKKLILSLLILLFINTNGITQNYYDVTFNIGHIDTPKAFVADSSGNIIVCGWFEDANPGYTRAFAIKIDTNGQELWRITRQDTSKYYALCITANGNIAFAGSKNNHCLLNLVDTQTGNEITSYFEDSVSSGYWFGTVNEITNDTDYYLYAIKTTDIGPHPIVFYKFNPLTGNFINKISGFNGPTYSPFYTSNSVAPNRVWVSTATTSEGLVIQKNFDNTGMFWTFDAFHIAGVERFSETRGCVVRAFQWSYNEYYMAVLTMNFFTNNVYGNAFQITHNNFTIGGSGVIGEKKIMITGTIDNVLSLWFINHNLTEMEEKTIPTDNLRIGIDVLGLLTEDIVVMGTESYNNNNAVHLFLIKLNSDGMVSTPENKAIKNFSVYPNPATNTIFINNRKGHNVKILFVNTFGETIKSVTNAKQSISIESLPKGLYIVITYIDGKLSGKEKLIKL